MSDLKRVFGGFRKKPRTGWKANGQVGGRDYIGNIILEMFKDFSAGF